MKHGPIALIDKNMPVVVLISNDNVFEKTLSNLKEVESRNGRIIAVTDHKNAELEEVAWEIIEVPATHRLLAPVLLRCHCSCSPIILRYTAAPTSTSRAIWPSQSPWSSGNLARAACSRRSTRIWLVFDRQPASDWTNNYRWAGYRRAQVLQATSSFFPFNSRAASIC